MFAKTVKLSFTIIFITLILSVTTNVFALQSDLTIKRLSGDNRYATSAKVALSGWSQSDYAVLAYGEDFPDALSAAPLAKKYNAPILLTETNSIPKETLDVIQQLKVEHIIIIGGTKIISSEVEQQLTCSGITVTRIFGDDRYETSVKIAEQLDNVTKIALVTGESFGDALSISPIAAKMNMPIILIRHNAIPSVVAEYINSHKLTKTYIIGLGTSLGNNILTGLTNVELVTGNDKYRINQNIIDKFKNDLNLSTIYIATGENFADALSGSILAGKNSNPLVLVGNNTESKKDYFTNNFGSTQNIDILGGIGAVTDDVVSGLIDASEASRLPVNSTVDKIEFISEKLTKTGTNSGTFEYKVLNRNGEDITKVVPASQLDASVLGGPSISLDSSTGTGTINFDSSNNYIENIITLVDRKTGISGKIDIPPLNPGTNVISIGSRIDKIMIISTVLGVGANSDGTPGKGYVTFKAYDQYGNDITSSGLVNNIMVTCNVGTASATRDGLIIIVPSKNIYLTTVKSVSITAIDTTTGVSTSATFTGSQ